MLFGPSRGFGIQGAFQIVTLIAEHFCDVNDHLGQGLTGAPMIANTDLLGINVGMKDGRGHAAKRWASRVIDWQKNFGLMHGAGCEGVLAGRDKAIDLKGKGIFLRRRALGFDESNLRVIGEHALD